MKTRTQPTYSFGTMVFRPRARQYLANDLIITVVCLAGLAVAGIDGMFMGNVLLWRHWRSPSASCTASSILGA